MSLISAGSISLDSTFNKFNSVWWNKWACSGFCSMLEVQVFAKEGVISLKVHKNENFLAPILKFVLFRS
jgi:hypothetical protein